MSAIADALRRPPVATGLVVVLLLGGLLVDLSTNQALVIAIIYNIPIAVSGAVANGRARRLTLWTIAAALGANVAAGYENALQLGSYETITVTNRGLAALSFLLVGAMALARESAEVEVSSLSDAEDEADREQRLRRMLRGLVDVEDQDELVSRAVDELRRLLDANALAVVAIDDGRFAEPRRGDQIDELAPVGGIAGWAVDAIPTNDRPAIATRSERGLVATGRWVRDGAEDLIVIADDPRVHKPAYLLGEAMHDLAALSRRF